MSNRQTNTAATNETGKAARERLVPAVDLIGGRIIAQSAGLRSRAPRRIRPAGRVR